MMFSTVVGFALRGTAQAGQTAEAVQIAQAELSRLQGLASEDRWAVLLAQTGAKSVRGFDVTISVSESALYSPSQTLEAPFVPLGLARELISVSAQAQVTVSRQNVRTTQQRRLFKPRKKLANPAIEFRGLPNSRLSPDGSVSVTAHLMAADGQELPATFEFNIIPGSGNGTLARLRNGREVRFTNVVQGPGGASLYTGGSCRLKASTVYFGKKISTDSTAVELSI